MDLSSAQLQLHSNFPHQESRSPDTMIADSKSPAENHHQPDQKKLRPPEDGPQKCPRCDSLNTKFCYYNNYSLTQPRYFCKACRRYWTKGGTLRNVPVGGGCRKPSKRSSSSASNSPSHFIKRAHTQDNSMTSPTAPNYPVFAGINSLHHAYSGGIGGLGFDAFSDAGVSFLGYSGMSYLPEIQYGNGLMYQGNLCNYDENGAGNSKCVSGVSDDVAAAPPYDDGIAVKQERGENDAFWWQSSESGAGLIDNSAWSLLNTPALM